MIKDFAINPGDPMNKFITVATAVSTLALSGCCFFGIGAPTAKAPAPAPVVAKAPAPAPAPAPVAPAAPAPAPKVAEKVSIALEVQFDTAKDVVKPQYDDQLKKVADFLKAYPASKAEIEGHTDNVGQAAYNKDLSQRRAAAVRQALINRFGCDGSRLSAAGYGPEKPLVANDTPANRAVNRRVVATFTAVTN